MTYPIRHSDRPALVAAAAHPGVIYEHTPDRRDQPGRVWAAFYHGCVAGLITRSARGWHVRIERTAKSKVVLDKDAATYTNALVALQQGLAKLGAEPGDERLLN